MIWYLRKTAAVTEIKSLLSQTGRDMISDMQLMPQKLKKNWAGHPKKPSAAELKKPFSGTWITSIGAKP